MRINKNLTLGFAVQLPVTHSRKDFSSQLVFHPDIEWRRKYWRDRYHENRFVKVWTGECRFGSHCLDHLLVTDLDVAGRDDDDDDESLSPGDGQVRLCGVTNRRYLGTPGVESIRGNFRMDLSGDLQLVNKELKHPDRRDQSAGALGNLRGRSCGEYFEVQQI